MVYDWKVRGIYPVEAQAAGEEISRIYEKYGSLTASDIVNESRDAAAPLHPCFEWDDAVAAEKYRERQAGDIVRAIVAVPQNDDAVEVTRAFVSIQNSYMPISVAVTRRDAMEELLATARRELAAFQRKYRVLTQLQAVFDAIDTVMEQSA